jgi:glucan 1,3-beta-glucosidase
VPGGAQAIPAGLCVAACQQAGYILAGVEDAQKWYGANILHKSGSAAPDSNVLCNMACLVNGAEICGAPNRLDSFTFGW